MKKKYYFVILFLLLTMVFIINTSSVYAVDATMYKILDSEGSIIIVTNNPTMLNKAQEEGYTILPILEESIKNTQSQIPNELENMQEILNGSEKYDFRETNWGMSREQVKATEDKKPVLDNNSGLAYEVSIKGENYSCSYFFLEDKLYHSEYVFIDEHTNKNDYIDDYEGLKKSLTQKYGRPFLDMGNWKNNLFKNYKQHWGIAISIGHLSYWATWETPTTEISLILSGENYEIGLKIIYESKELKEWVVKEILEKETSKDF